MKDDDFPVSLEFLRRQLDLQRSETTAVLSTGLLPPNSSSMSEIDAKIAAAEARTDTKFAEMMGELRVIESSTRGTKATVIGTGIAAVALVVAIFTWGSQMFGVGMDAQSVADQAARSVEQRTAPQLQNLNVRYEHLEGQIGQLIQLLQADEQRSPFPQQESPGDLAPTPFPMPEMPPPD